jgi:hypothetical protein
MHVAAVRITSSTIFGCESIGTWLLSISYVVAHIRCAAKRCNSGWTVRSFLATMYRLGSDRHSLKRRNDPVERRPVGPDPVNENDARSVWHMVSVVAQGLGQHPALALIQA